LLASLRDLRRMTDILQLTEVAGAADLDRDVKKLGVKPTAAELAAVDKRVRSAWMEGLPAAFRAGDTTRRVAIGWAVHPHDLPVAPRPGLDFDLNPEMGNERTKTVAMHRWLGEARYRADARALKRESRDDIDKAVRAYAAAVDVLGREYQDWKP